MVIGPWSSSLFENIGQLNARNFHILEFSCPWLKRPKTIKFGFLSIFQLVKLLKNRIREIGKNYDIAIEIASNYDQIRGFGHIKKRNIEIAKSCEDKLLSAFNG